MAESLNNYFLVTEGGDPSELAFTPSAEVLSRYPIDLSTGLATLQPPQDQGPAISDLERIAYAAPTPPRIDFTSPPVLGMFQPQQPVTPAAAPPRVSYAARSREDRHDANAQRGLGNLSAASGSCSHAFARQPDVLRGTVGCQD